MPAIKHSTSVPNATYFTIDSAAPRVNDAGDLIILNGKGTSRRWGHPQVSSVILTQDSNFCAVLVGYFHKHGGDQAWRYYRVVGNAWQRVPRFTLLTTCERVKVACAWILATAQGTIPDWANAPSRRIATYLPDNTSTTSV